eukprot:c19304_g1_i3 orf=593-901(-)
MDRVGKVGRAYEVPVTFDNVRDKNLMQLKKLNTAIFPVKYKDSLLWGYMCWIDSLSSGKEGGWWDETLHHDLGYLGTVPASGYWIKIIEEYPGSLPTGSEHF